MGVEEKLDSSSRDTSDIGWGIGADQIIVRKLLVGEMCINFSQNQKGFGCIVAAG